MMTWWTLYNRCIKLSEQCDNDEQYSFNTEYIQYCPFSTDCPSSSLLVPPERHICSLNAE
jgi:hypothetical protein